MLIAFSDALVIACNGVHIMFGSSPVMYEQESMSAHGAALKTLSEPPLTFSFCCPPSLFCVQAH